jgi:acetoacetyl-CoA synthetase
VIAADDDDAPLWRPPPERAAATPLAAFARRAGRERYDDLHAWSIDAPHEFWPMLWDELAIIGDRGARVLEDPAAAMADARFFPDARLSFAENLLRGDPASLAVIAYAADGARRELTRGELRARVARAAVALRARGVGVGTRVAAALPNTPDAIAVMLGANAVGAIASLCDSELGLDAIVDRFAQIEPAVVIAPDRIRDPLAARLPTARHACAPDELQAGDAPQVWSFHRAAFNDPAFILYTSGTTGLPKCIVHNTGGQLLQLFKELRLHYDVRPGDRFFYQTSTGWNMWYWVVIALAAGATIVLRDGSPLRPRADALFAMAAAERVTHVGVSPAYLAHLRAAGVRPRDAHAMPELRAVMSTGAPLSPALYDFVYDAIAPDVHLISLSGGTEVNACFVTGDPTAPVYRGEIQRAALGMATAVVDDAGAPVARAKGELVCTRPFPSQPIGLWNDPGRARYLATYFERYPGIWHHGDFAETTAHDGYVIHGRSDATLKPGGHRIGTAEIYRQLETIDAIADSVAIAQRWQDDVRVVLFVRLRDGAALDVALEREIRMQILRGASPYHVPARVLAVTEIPYTRTGKKAEISVRQAVHGEPVTNVTALANPECLREFASRPELAR